jgi:hypothetical protein
MGGCDPDQPHFAGTTCATVADEFGQEMARRLRAITEGPKILNSEGKSARMYTAQSLVSVRARQHLVAVGLGSSCQLRDFTDAVTRAVGPDLQTAVADAWWGLNAGDFQGWLDQFSPMVWKVVLGNS